MPQEFYDESSELARLAFDPEKTSGAVLVWDSVLDEEDLGHARPLVYELEGWNDKRDGWIANDTTNPGELFGLGDIADAQEVKFFGYFLLGVRGGLSTGETIEADKDRFRRFEAAGGEFGKFSWTGKRPKGAPA